jgi:hypothetical protein
MVKPAPNLLYSTGHTYKPDAVATSSYKTKQNEETREAADMVAAAILIASIMSFK